MYMIKNRFVYTITSSQLIIAAAAIESVWLHIDENYISHNDKQFIVTLMDI